MTICRSEVRKGLVHRRSNDPQINETFKFPVSHVPSLHAVSHVPSLHAVSTH